MYHPIKADRVPGFLGMLSKQRRLLVLEIVWCLANLNYYMIALPFLIAVVGVSSFASLVEGFGPAVFSINLAQQGGRPFFNQKAGSYAKRNTLEWYLPSSALSASALESEDDTPTSGSSTLSSPPPRATILKEELFQLADRTKRGFQSSNADRQRANDILMDLSKLNPTAEPASSYYENDSTTTTTNTTTLSGKWTLVYTDAPDITSLDRSTITAKLGRIGQECNPPYIKNVIEWLRPDWAANLPFSGTTKSRVLQKVVTLASASPSKPLTVNLKVGGLELQAGKDNNKEEEEDSTDDDDWIQRIQKQGLPVGLLGGNPIDLKGPLNPPFGQFTVLYLDDDFRAIRTYQNYVACNRRITEPDEEWF